MKRRGKRGKEVEASKRNGSAKRGYDYIWMPTTIRRCQKMRVEKRECREVRIPGAGGDDTGPVQTDSNAAELDNNEARDVVG
jgi:hypothetical protein